MTQPTASSIPAQAGEPKSSLRYGWYVVAVLTVIYMFSFVDRQILSLLVPQIKRDLGVSDTQIGLLQGLAFALFYTFMGLPLGRMIDTYNRRNLVTVCIVVWSIFTAGCAATKSFLSLFLARIGVGVGEAGLNPAAFSLMADYFPRERMGAAVSVYYMGLFFGSSLALVVSGVTVETLARTPMLTLPILGSIVSWRVTFLIVGLPGLVFALLLRTVREPLRRGLLLGADGRPARPGFAETFAQIRLRWQSFAGITAGMIFQATANYAVNAWLPVYFLRVHGWTQAQTGKVVAALLILFACSGMYLGGRLSDRLQKRGVLDAPLRVGVASGAGMLLFLAPATAVSDLHWAIALLAPGLFFMAVAMGTAVAALQVIFPNQSRGQVGAMFLFCLNLGGLTLGPLMPGLLDDRLFHNENMIGASLAITVAGAAVLMLVLMAATCRPYRRHAQETC